MKKNSVAKNYIYNLAYQILTLIVPLFTTPYLSRVLGAEAIGIYSYTLSIATYFVLFGSLGVAMYGQREIAYIQEKKYERSKIFYEILIMRFITLCISMSIFYISFCTKGQFSIYYKILILELIATTLDISWFFQGLEEFKKTVIRNIIIKMFSVLCIFVFIKDVTDLNKYFYIYVMSNFIGNVSLWTYLPKIIEKIKFKELRIFKHFKPTFTLFIPQVAIQIYTVLDKTMIGTIVNDKAEVGFYEQAQKIVKLLLTIATSLGTVMMPRIANTFANGNKDKLKEYMNTSFSFITMLAFPLMFGAISVASNFVPMFFGDGYEKVIYLMSIISPIIVAIGLSNVIGTQYLLSTKQQKKYTISVIIGAFTNFVLNFILIKNYASIGASIATVIAEFTVTGVQFYLVKKEIKILDVIKISYKYLVASTIMFICSICIDYIILNNVLSIIVQVLVSTIVYFICLIFLKDKLIFSGLYVVKNKIKLVKNR